MLTPNEIRDRAHEFALEWQDEKEERAEAQSFWNAFFYVFGVSRRMVATYEKRAQSLSANGNARRIDLFWRKVLLVEHKSAGGDLQKAQQQMLEYLELLPDEDMPRYCMVCDFSNFILHDLETSKEHIFTLAELPQKIHLFDFISGHETAPAEPEPEADIKASKLMGKISAALEESHYEGGIEELLTRLLFCLFADDTGIFNKNTFSDYLQKYTTEDGSDLGSQLQMIFQILNTPENRRQETVNDDLLKFPYVNGELFEQRMLMAAFNTNMRAALLQACSFDWSKISPAVFGSLFQTVREPKARRGGGEHYTSEKNILKVIRPLFMNELRKEFVRAGQNKRALNDLHNKIAKMTFLDPACGCGNFLIVAYRELRLLEMDILDKLYPRKRGGGRTGLLNIKEHCLIDVDSFYGIEIGAFPAEIAKVALWLVDHQMNNEMSKRFGKNFIRIPLVTSPGIVCRNALEIEWDKVLPPEKVSYILGNPPFVGVSNRRKEQKREMMHIFDKAAGAQMLDYVCAWYAKAARYIHGHDICCAFVSTNSITQGMQVSALWSVLKNERIKIHFAHRTFRWNNEAPGIAGVHVVIIGFSNHDITNKVIYDYPDIKGEPLEKSAATINGYLVDAPDIIVAPQTRPLCKSSPMVYGSKPADGGHLLFSNEEKKEFLQICPEARQFIRPALSSESYLHGIKRWCLWLKDEESSAFLHIQPIMERINKVRKFRLSSKKASTQEDAETPHLFTEIRQPDSAYIVVPLTSSENRTYVPMGFFPKKCIALNACSILPKGDLYHFGIISSSMHMAWMRAVCGRLESRYRYSNKLVYNTFPWPEVTEERKGKIKTAAQLVLDARAAHSSTLADMYSVMPKDVLQAHRKLDREVDRLYRRQPFESEIARLDYLFTEYSKLTAPIVPPNPRPRRRRK